MRRLVLLLIAALVVLTSAFAQVRSKRISLGTQSGLPDLYASIEFRDENANKILENRESGKIILTLFNSGKGRAEGIVVTVTDLSPDPNLVISAPQERGILSPGDSAVIAFDVEAKKRIQSKEHKLQILVTEMNGQDMDPAYLILPTLAYDPPKLNLAGVEIIKVGEGLDVKGLDGQLHPKEIVLVRVVVQNVGQSPAPHVRYTVSNTHRYIHTDSSAGTLGTIKPGEIKEFRFRLTTPAMTRMEDVKGDLPLYLTTLSDEEEGNLTSVQLPLQIDRLPPKQNIVEVKPRLESLKKTFATFELSKKFKAASQNIIDVRSVIPSLSKRPQSVGVVIGVENYRELAPAPYAANDATVMEQYFKNALGVEQVIVLKNEEVTLANLDDIFNPRNGDLSRAVRRGETDVFVYYSGHGIPDKTGETTYLFPNDGKVANLEHRAMALPTFYADLNALGARSVTVMLDACFSGAARRTQNAQMVNLTGQKGIKLHINRPWEAYQNFTVINSSTGDETSLGFDEAETGLFTYFLTAGLRGEADRNKDGKITLGELKEYVIRNVMETSRRKSGLQTPEFFGDDSQVLVEYKR